jgi:hypothetical protein
MAGQGVLTGCLYRKLQLHRVAAFTARCS